MSDKIHEMFEAVVDEFLEFDRIPVADRRNQMPDVCGLLYLQEKLGMPQGKDAVASAVHDEIYLGWTGGQIKKLTQDDVLYINRCGVRYDSGVDSLCMFV